MKYNLSVGAIFKNESLILKEWLEHYLKRGIEHFYLINDNSDDNYLDILNQFRDYITLFNVDEIKNSDNRQKYFYNKFFKFIKHETKWILICDLDEFVWSPLHLNMNQTLILLEKENISSYLINSVLFGSNGYEIQPSSIVNSFTKRQSLDNEYHKWILKYDQYKTIGLSNNVERFQIHRQISIYEHKNKIFIPQSNKEKNIPLYIKDIDKTLIFHQRADSFDINNNFFRLNHYRLQSKERWLNIVIKRGDATKYNPKNLNNFSPNINQENKNINFRTLEIFHKANEIQNEVEDFDLVNQNP
jgi:hypothetical protein